MDERIKSLGEDIPSKYLDKFDSISKESWKHEDFRRRVLEICTEHHNHKEFAKEVKEVFEELLHNDSYIDRTKTLAKAEAVSYIDQSRVRTVFWIVGLVIAATVGLILQKTFNIF